MTSDRLSSGEDRLSGVCAPLFNGKLPFHLEQCIFAIETARLSTAVKAAASQVSFKLLIIGSFCPGDSLTRFQQRSTRRRNTSGFGVRESGELETSKSSMDDQPA